MADASDRRVDFDALPDIPGGWSVRSIDVESVSFELALPDQPDEFLDDPIVQAANRQSDYMPYWAYLWPSAELMARLVLQKDWGSRNRVLEIGAGLGLVGIAALHKELDVTFSDYDETAVTVAQQNARRNGFQSHAGLSLDWRRLDSVMAEPFDVILGCDVIYEESTHAPVLDVLDRFLATDGVCWIGDPGRQYVEAYCRLAEDRGYAVSVRDKEGRTIERPFTNLEAGSRFKLLVVRRADQSEPVS